jgi:predicted NBD/HSP70 family sugar kinase
MIIAIDIGGTKTLVAKFDANGVIGEVEHFSTPKNTTTFFSELHEVLARFLPQPGDTIMVASAGLVDSKQKVILHSPNLGWTNVLIGEELTRRYGCVVYLENDAVIGGLGAALALPGVPPLVLYVTVGTGIGGGLVVNGRIHDGLNHIEIGHMVINNGDGLEVWEHLASGTAFKKLFGKQVAEISEPEEWETIADRLSIGLRVLIPALQPGLILIGGGVGAHFESFGELLATKLRKQVPQFIPIPPIQKAPDPEKAVLNGCYHYVSQLSTPA